jgi:hypothetical protein
MTGSYVILTVMSTRELLIEEINHAPEDLLKLLLQVLQVELKKRGFAQPARPATTGPYAAYWNQFIGRFADEEWERPPQDVLEQREEW